MRLLVLLVRVRLSLLLCLIAAPLQGAGSLTEPGPEIVRGENDAAWAPLFAALAEKGPVSASFTERRLFAVRKQPVVVEGEMRLIPARGLSLRYGDRTVIVDARGVLLRDARGRTRTAKPDHRNPAANTLLLPVLRFDRQELEKTFTLRGARSEKVWRLDFIPRSPASDDGVGKIVVHGVDQAITRIELRPATGVHIEIVLTSVQTDVNFSDEEVRRFFR
jgi:hypothetical protein